MHQKLSRNLNDYHKKETANGKYKINSNVEQYIQHTWISMPNDTDDMSFIIQCFHMNAQFFTE